MLSILPDGGAEPKPQIETAPHLAVPATTQSLRSRLRAWRRADATRAEFVRSSAVIVTLLAGGWFLLRGLSANTPDSLLLPYPASDVAGVLRLNLAAMALGIYLLVVAVALAAQRMWAWPLLVIGAVAAIALSITATVVGGVLDVMGLLLGILLIVTAAHPAVRHRTIPANF